jgi:hypothetical protein
LPCFLPPPPLWEGSFFSQPSFQFSHISKCPFPKYFPNHFPHLPVVFYICSKWIPDGLNGLLDMTKWHFEEITMDSCNIWNLKQLAWPPLILHSLSPPLSSHSTHFSVLTSYSYFFAGEWVLLSLTLSSDADVASCVREIRCEKFIGWRDWLRSRARLGVGDYPHRTTTFQSSVHCAPREEIDF